VEARGATPPPAASPRILTEEGAEGPSLHPAGLLTPEHNGSPPSYSARWAGESPVQSIQEICLQYSALLWYMAARILRLFLPIPR
jgi:hypothetical protein